MRRSRTSGLLLALLGLLAGVLVVAGPASRAEALPAPPPCGVAGNLVQNCGFETGDFSSWNVTPASSGSILLVGGGSHSGGAAAVFAGVGSTDDQISQSLAGTTEGQTYLVEFWLSNFDVNNDNHFSAQVDTGSGTTTLYDQTNANAFGYTLITGSFVAGASAPTITFAGRNGPSSWALDDIAVTAAASDCSSVAGNLVANCGFESGLSPWNQTDATDGGSLAGVAAWGAHSGNSAAYLGATGGADDQFDQTINGTTEGSTYLVQFWSRNDDTANDNHLLVQVGNTSAGTVTVLEQTNANAYGYTLYTGSFVAGAGAPDLTIAGRNPPAYFYLDDVSVSPVPPVVTLSPTTLPDATGGAAYSQTLSGSGASAPYTFEVTGGSLPAGLTLSSDGTLSGTPTEYGQASFTVTASDAGGYRGWSDYTLTVQSPTIVLPSTLPNPTYGAAYSQSAAASGGTAPYTYAVTSGALPDGLALDSSTGTISGTPTAAGGYDFTVTATDSGTGTGPASGSQAYSLTVAKATPTLQITAPTTGGVVGDSAPITSSSSATGLTVTFSSGSAAVCSVSGSTVTYLHPGTCEIDADQAGDSNNEEVTTSTTVPVSQASTTLAVAVQPHSIVATVSVTAPGAGAPTGTVTFAVGGTTVGSAPVSGSIATLNYSVPTGATQQVSAVYSGDTDFVGSSASTSRSDPSITAQVTSATPKTRYGWYRTPISVHFTCTTNGAPLIHACPATVTLTRNGAGMSVTRTIIATDGGAATVSVTGLNLDQTAPKVQVRGIADGAVYGGIVPRAYCAASDALSGVASCTIHRHTVGTVTSFTATATDRAGNTSSVSGSYRVPLIYLNGVRFANQAWQVQLGHNYTLVVTHSTVRPRYVDAAPYPQKPTGLDNLLTRTGPERWSITVGITRSLGHGTTWNIGVLIGKTLHVLRIHTQ